MSFRWKNPAPSATVGTTTSGNGDGSSSGQPIQGTIEADGRIVVEVSQLIFTSLEQLMCSLESGPQGRGLLSKFDIAL